MFWFSILYVIFNGAEQSEQDRVWLLNRLTNRPFIDFLDIKRPIKILDVGCGLGILAREIAALYPNCEIFGIEFSEAQLAQVSQELPNISLQQGDAHHLPFDDNSFDMVYCRYLLEHVKGSIQVLREMRRVAKSGGEIFTQENNIEITVI